MGRGIKWTSNERTTVCLAWVNATNNNINGKDQSGEQFWKSVYENVKLMKVDYEEGTYAGRGQEAIKGFIKNSIFPDVQKFNASLRTIRASKPTGCNDTEIISMAVAVHLKQASSRDYKHKNFNCEAWPNYHSWMTLKLNPKFRDVASAVHTHSDVEHTIASNVASNVVQTKINEIMNPEEIDMTGTGTGTICIDIPEDDLKMPAVSLSGQRKAKRERALDIEREKKNSSLKGISTSLDKYSDEMKKYNEVFTKNNKLQEEAETTTALKDLIIMTKKGSVLEDMSMNIRVQKKLMKRLAAKVAPVLEVTSSQESIGNENIIGTSTTI
jgi:hypothetical protein